MGATRWCGSTAVNNGAFLLERLNVRHEPEKGTWKKSAGRVIGGLEVGGPSDRAGVAEAEGQAAFQRFLEEGNGKLDDLLTMLRAGEAPHEVIWVGLRWADGVEVAVLNRNELVVATAS